jgi:hypothetical protein
MLAISIHITNFGVINTTLCNRYTNKSFPRNQHRPVLLRYGICVPLTESIEKPRWNFSSVVWKSFAADIDHVVRFILACLDSFERFSNAIRAASKRHVPRGFRKAYIPGWNQDYENLYQEYDRAIANRLLEEFFFFFFFLFKDGMISN